MTKALIPEKRKISQKLLYSAIKLFISMKTVQFLKKIAEFTKSPVKPKTHTSQKFQKFVTFAKIIVHFFKNYII